MVGQSPAGLALGDGAGVLVLGGAGLADAQSTAGPGQESQQWTRSARL